MEESKLQRNKQGQFLPGNKEGAGFPKAGAGRPPAARREIIERVLSGEDWESLVAVAQSKALDGDFRFLEWLFDQKFGKQTTSAVVEAHVSGEPVAKLTDEQIAARIAELEARGDVDAEESE